MASTDLSEPSGRRPLVAADVTNKTAFKAIRIHGAAVELNYYSGGVEQTHTYADGALEIMTFTVATLPSNPENCLVYPDPTL